jgi:hypothetical protein
MTHLGMIGTAFDLHISLNFLVCVEPDQYTRANITKINELAIPPSGFFPEKSGRFFYLNFQCHVSFPDLG